MPQVNSAGQRVQGQGSSGNRESDWGAENREGMCRNEGCNCNRGRLWLNTKAESPRSRALIPTWMGEVEYHYYFSNNIYKDLHYIDNEKNNN